MRQIFTSPRLENVEGVAKLLREADIEIKVSDDRGYKQVSRREFSYADRKSGGANYPAVWVIKSDDYKRARELLRDAGLIDVAPAPPISPKRFRQGRQRKPIRRNG